MANLSGHTVLSSTTTRSRNLFSSKFSALNSLIGSKKNHITDYDVELDEPVRIYGPGDTVSGKVILSVAKPLGVTHIVVCLYGYVQVFKSNTKPKSGVRNTYGRVAGSRGKRWVSEYHGDGFASLFEEEIVLCGQGRLDPKLYHFRFNLDFPSDPPLPSSIDFDRGVIAYTLSSTLTRPTSITTTTSCERNVRFQEAIDVRTLPPPKPRIVTLEPVDTSRKSRANLIRLTPSGFVDKQTHSLASKSSIADSNSRKAPAITGSIGAVSSRLGSPLSSCNNSKRSSVAVPESESKLSHTSTSPNAKSTETNITATIQLGQAGCMPGEVIPLKVTIQHCRVVRSLHGIIATLYRQARTDMHPNLALGPAGRAGDQKYEDYYPRSRTGLGGMSLSAAGSSQVWRKDLSQTFAPLYIDPQTMSAEVKVSIRVPEDVFPSIRTAPGEMISFKYFVEVIIDIHGRLASHDRPFPSLQMTAVQPAIGETPLAGEHDDRTRNAVTAWGQNCIDTTQIRREKNAITCLCDVVVGTVGSVKAQGKQRQLAGTDMDVPMSTSSQSRPVTTRLSSRDQQWSDDRRSSGGDYAGREPPYIDTYGVAAQETDDHHSLENCSHGGRLPRLHVDGHDQGHEPHHGRAGRFRAVSPIESLGEADLPEKERLRRAEARLLPSQPPGAQENPSASAEAPSAPLLPEEDYHPPRPAQRASNRGTYINTVTHDADMLSPPYSKSHRPASGGGEALPIQVSREADEAIAVSPTILQDDKQELQRRLLQARASAPPEQVGSTPDDEMAGPTAPVFGAASEVQRPERGQGNRRVSRGTLTESPSAGEEGLPRYER